LVTIETYPLPAKIAALQMARFANAVIEPAKIAYFFDGRGPGKKLNYKLKGLIVRRISSHITSATDIAA
jgi:hypothetical protein